ncbi:MAG: two-component regulator propeller domain-containing protein [Bacteroidales bacterium]
MMKSLNTAILGLALLFLSLTSDAQIAIGQWRDHLPYSKTIAVAEAGDIIYTATPFSLFYYDKNDESISRLSKVNGLSDIGISAIGYNDEHDVLLVAYTNTNIDLIKGNEIINISDIKRKQILGNKTINNIYYRDSLAYLACGFGIVVLDVKNEEFPEPTYYIGPNGSQVNVLDITMGMDTIYAGTENGIYKALLDSPNLADYNAWSKDQNLYPNETFNTIEYFSGRLLANNNNEGYNTDTLFMYEYATDTWSKFPDMDRGVKFHMKSMGDQLVITSDFKIYLFDQNYSLISEIWQAAGGYLQSRDATLDADGIFWIADFGRGLIKTTNGSDAENITPNGPYSPNVFDMSLQGQELWVASGGRNATWGKLYLSDGVYNFSGESWKNYNRGNIQAFDSISDMTCVVADPNNPARAMVGTWSEGVMEFVDGEVVNVFSDSNSSLQKWELAGYVAVSGVDFDSYNNLWVVNSGAPNILSVKKTNGEWRSFNLGSNATGIDGAKMMVDSYNQKWIMVRADHQLLVFTDNNTIDDPTDDILRTLTNSSGLGNLPGNKILSLAEDQDGEIWIGSDEGIGVIYSPGNIFTGGNYDAQRILVEVDGYVQYLLESESVTAIAIDGENRKWIGTERAGVFLLSPDGTREIHHFTVENSPLYSNLIVDIEINNVTGEVFFATDKGIVSYKSTAQGPDPADTTGVVVYPNPVREGYKGYIAIKGLMPGADVKITDVSGNLVFATRVDNEGTQAEWNVEESGEINFSGTNFSGRKASTGVYLVFATDENGNEKLVTKILFIN